MQFARESLYSAVNCSRTPSDCREVKDLQRLYRLGAESEIAFAARKDVLWHDKPIPRGPVVLCKQEIIGLLRAFISVGRSSLALLQDVSS